MLLQPAPSTAAAGDGGAAPGQQPPRQTDVADYAAPSLATTEGRLRTFRHGDWPVSFLTAEEVAAAGFYFLRRGDDAVKCFYCDVVINKWEPSDDPLAEHRRWSPRCPFLSSSRRGCADAVSYDSCSPFERPAALQSRAQPKPTPVHATRPAWPQYCTRGARLASFKDWPPAIPVKPVALCEAGFFYSGSGDRTICYYCGRGLRDWEASDDPWVEHELWFPGCWHVLLHRGNDFVNEIAQKRDALIAAKTDPHQTATEISKSQPRRETPDSRVEETENGATEEKRLCKICFEKEMGVVFLPCGHIVACVDCALSVADCPVCRQPFQNTARVYLP